MINRITQILNKGKFKSGLLLGCFFVSSIVTAQDANPVTNLTVTEGVPNEFTINWTAPVGGGAVTNYNVFIQERGGAFTYSGTVGAGVTTYTFSTATSNGVTVVDGGIYSASVESLDDVAQDNYVATGDFSLNTPDPSPPTGLTIIDGANPNEFTMTWDANTAAFGGFNVFLNGGATYLGTVAEGVNSFTFTSANGIIDGSVYNPAVEALPDADFNAYSNTTTPAINTYTWTGTTSNDWSVGSNWDRGDVPSSVNLTVNIPSGLTNYPTASSAVTIKKINISSGATFIPQNTVSGLATYTRNLPTTNWYLVSSPLENELIQNVIANHSFAIGSGPNIGLASYKNDGSDWSYKTSASMGELAFGEGYSVKFATSGDLSFSGVLKTSDTHVNVSRGVNNYFFMGNPYTAYVNSLSFIAHNVGPITNQTIWLWDGSQYVTYNNVSPVQIAPGQGFFVELNTDPIQDVVSFPFSNRSHQVTDTFMRHVPVSNLELFVESESAKVSTKAYYLSGKTIGYDNGYDSKMFGGVAYDFAVFTELVSDNHGEKLAIQTLPKDAMRDVVIPIGLISEIGKEITFSVNVENLPEGMNVYIEDRFENTFTNLSEKKHTVTLNKAHNGIGQFYLHTTSGKLSVKDTENDVDNISIYKSSNDELIIAGLNAEAEVQVYSVLGKKLLTTQINSKGLSKVGLPVYLNSGVYIVKLNSERGNLTRKIILE